MIQVNQTEGLYKFDVEFLAHLLYVFYIAQEYNREDVFRSLNIRCRPTDATKVSFQTKQCVELVVHFFFMELCLFFPTIQNFPDLIQTTYVEV